MRVVVDTATGFPAPAAGTATGSPSVGWAGGPLGAVQAADREIARQTALRARAVAAFAETRPSSADRPAGTPGAMSAERRAARPEVVTEVSEWAAQKLVVALSITQNAAENLLERSLTLVHRLPATLLALESGLIHVGHLWPLLERVAPIHDATVRARVENEVLDWKSSRQVTTPPQLTAKVRRSVLRHDAAAAAQRLARALRERGVSVRADRREGMAVFEALLTVPESQALLDALGRYADALDDATEPVDRRTRGQKMADCLLDLVLRPGEHRHGPVQAQVTVVAGVRTLLGGDQAGEVAGQVVPAEMVRALARALRLLPEAPPTPGPGRPLPEHDLWPDEPPAETWTSAMRAADERWWAEVEARALRSEWGGEEDPPPEEMARWWAAGAEQTRWWWPEAEQLEPLLGCPAPQDGRESANEPPPYESEPGNEPPQDGRESANDPLPEDGADGWARADRAVDEAGRLLLELQRATSRANRAVADARRTDAYDHEVWADSPAGRVDTASADLEALRAAADEQREALAALLGRGAGRGLLDRPRLAVVDELTGALLCLTDSDELRRHATCGSRGCRRDPAGCDHDLSDRPGLGPPAPSPGYRPGARLGQHVRARDRRCRFPGCRRPVPLGGELDHDRPWPDGPTSAGNLTGYCTGHHRGKHQAPGWRHSLARDGTLTVTTPTGLVATTTPPPF